MVASLSPFPDSGGAVSGAPSLWRSYSLWSLKGLKVAGRGSGDQLGCFRASNAGYAVVEQVAAPTVTVIDSPGLVW